MKTILKNALPVAFALAALPTFAKAEQRQAVDTGNVSACVFKIYPQFRSITMSNHSPKFLLDRPFTVGVPVSFLDSASAYKISIYGAGNLPAGTSNPFRVETAEFDLTSGIVSLERYLAMPKNNDGISVSATLNIAVPYSSLTDADKKIMDNLLDCAKKSGVTGIGYKRPVQGVPSLPPSIAKPR